MVRSISGLFRQDGQQILKPDQEKPGKSKGVTPSNQIEVVKAGCFATPPSNHSSNQTNIIDDPMMMPWTPLIMTTLPTL